MSLNCAINGHQPHSIAYLNQSTVYWDHKHCERVYAHQLACETASTRHRPWTRLRCGANDDDASCSATLLLARPSESSSGLYRCSVQPYRPDGQTTLQIQVVKTYQLDIISEYIGTFSFGCQRVSDQIRSVADLSIATPEIHDDQPANTTALAGSQVVMPCHVHSQVMPTIKWFRKHDQADDDNAGNDDADSLYSYRNGSGELSDGNWFDVNNTGTHSSSSSSFHGSRRLVQFLDSTYENVESAGERGLPNDMYLSKLIFHRVRESDAGTYVCVAINYRGYTLREVVLEVCASADSGEREAVPIDRTPLMLLFLIPLGLAAMPVLMWAFYLLCRSREQALEARRAKGSQQLAMGRKYSLVCQNEVYV